MTDKRDQLIVNMEKENTILSEKQPKEDHGVFVCLKLKSSISITHRAYNIRFLLFFFQENEQRGLFERGSEPFETTVDQREV